jgi:hypothetical protein
VKRGRVVPYPLARRRDLVLRLAEQMAVRAPGAAEKHLAQQIKRHVAILQRKGVDSLVIEEQTRALKSAVLSELFRVVLTRPGPGGAA